MLRDSTNFKSRLQAPRVQVEEQARVETPKRSAKGRQSAGTPLAFLLEKSLLGPQPELPPQPAQGRPSLGGTPSKIPAPKVRVSLGGTPSKIPAPNARTSLGGAPPKADGVHHPPSLLPAYDRRQSTGGNTPQGIERTGSTTPRGNAPSTALSSTADKPVNKALANRMIAPGPSSFLSPRNATSGPLRSRTAAGASSANKPLRATPLKATPLKATPAAASVDPPASSKAGAAPHLQRRTSGGLAPARRLSTSGGCAAPARRPSTGGGTAITPQLVRNTRRGHAAAAGVAVVAVVEPVVAPVPVVVAPPSTPLFAPSTDTKSKLAQMRAALDECDVDYPLCGTLDFGAPPVQQPELEVQSLVELAALEDAGELYPAGDAGEAHAHDDSDGDSSGDSFVFDEDAEKDYFAALVRASGGLVLSREEERRIEGLPSPPVRQEEEERHTGGHAEPAARQDAVGEGDASGTGFLGAAPPGGVVCPVVPTGGVCPAVPTPPRVGYRTFRAAGGLRGVGSLTPEKRVQARRPSPPQAPSTPHEGCAGLEKARDAAQHASTPQHAPSTPHEDCAGPEESRAHAQQPSTPQEGYEEPEKLRDAMFSPPFQDASCLAARCFRPQE
ncbi:hypothetical protein T484DRAFT_1928794 [Baffinella frigidus]|nr:hypothetical protein T484DRAFT_1928794 [Cryptophyta sp. CCMP2293]